MEPSFNSRRDVTTDDWGKYIVKWDDIIRIERDGVLENIKHQNPAIKAVDVDWNTDDLIDWATAGKSIGTSNHISYLAVHIREIRDPYDVQAFFRGLAMNKSIIALKIDIGIQEEEDDSECVKKAFKALLPFFQRNNKLQVFDVIYDGKSYPEGCVNDVLTAAKSLKSIHLKYHDDWEATTKTIIEKGHVHHLSLNNGPLSRGACVNIRNLLSDQECVLSSLTLYFQPSLKSQHLYVGEIINGLSNNQSLKCLKLIGLDEKLATCFIDSMRHLRHSALETIYISGGCRDRDTIKFPSLHAFVQQMPNVKSLSLYNFGADRNVQEANNSIEPSVTSALRELSMERMRRGEKLYQLSSFILNNTSLRVLVLDSRDVSSASQVTFFDTVRHAKYLESIRIKALWKDVMIESFSNWVVSTRTLKVLEISLYNNISSVGQQLFAAALASLENLEDIKLDEDALRDSEAAMLLLNAFIAKPTLKKVSLISRTGAQLQVILNTIGSPTCGITEMKIGYCNPRGGTEERIHEQAAHEQTLANSLQSNASLRILEFHVLCGRRVVHWPSFADIFCNTSSIDATFRSNHVLESLSLCHAKDMPFDIYNMLYLNRNPDKHSVIREKIFRNHNLHEVNFVPTLLPIVFSWLGHPDIDQKLGLSQLFGILRAVPHMIVKKVD
jgi:hypothetical protein